VSVNEVRDEAFDGGGPRVEIGLVVGNGVVAEFHGDEPHLFGNAGGLSWVELPIPLSLLERGLRIGLRCWNCILRVIESGVTGACCCYGNPTNAIPLISD